jgi:hypothetical protein
VTAAETAGVGVQNGRPAQGLIAFILWGLGAFVGTLLAGKVMSAHKLPQSIGTIEHDWEGIWMQPALGAAAVLVLFSAVFREPGAAAASPSGSACPRP